MVRNVNTRGGGRRSPVTIIVHGLVLLGFLCALSLLKSSPDDFQSYTLFVDSVQRSLEHETLQSLDLRKSLAQFYNNDNAATTRSS
jgi:hypothetical protein